MKNRVEEFRKRMGLNQDDLAKALKVSRQTISSLELAFVISEYFKKSIEEIFIFK